MPPPPPRTPMPIYFEINLFSKYISRAEPEYMNIHTPQLSASSPPWIPDLQNKQIYKRREYASASLLISSVRSTCLVSYPNHIALTLTCESESSPSNKLYKCLYEVLPKVATNVEQGKKIVTWWYNLWLCSVGTEIVDY